MDCHLTTSDNRVGKSRLSARLRFFTLLLSLIAWSHAVVDAPARQHRTPPRTELLRTQGTGLSAQAFPISRTVVANRQSTPLPCPELPFEILDRLMRVRLAQLRRCCSEFSRPSGFRQFKTIPRASSDDSRTA